MLREIYCMYNVLFFRCAVLFSKPNNPVHQSAQSIFTATYLNWDCSTLYPWLQFTVILTDLIGDSGRLRLEFWRSPESRFQNCFLFMTSFIWTFYHYLWRRIRETNELNYRKNCCDCYWSSEYLASKSIRRDLFTLWVFNCSLSECTIPNNLMLCSDDWEDPAAPLQIFDHHSCSDVQHFPPNDVTMKCGKAAIEKPENKMFAWTKWEEVHVCK